LNLWRDSIKASSQYSYRGYGYPIFARGEIKKTWEWKGQDFGANNKFSGLKQKDEEQTSSRSSSWDRAEWQNTRNNVIWWGIPISGPPDKFERQQLGNNFVWLFCWLDTEAQIHRFTFNNCPGHVYMTSISLRVNELKWIFIAQQRLPFGAALIFCLM